MAVGADIIADFTVDNYLAVMMKHPQRHLYCSGPTKVKCFTRSEFHEHHKALLPFPNGSTTGLDIISLHIFEDPTAKLNRKTRLTF